MRQNRAEQIKIVTLAALILIIALLHWLSGFQESPYYGVICRFYYLPIILAGIWFALRGGMAAALIISVVFAPHLMFQWGEVPLDNLNQALEVLAFNVTGFVTGLLSLQIHRQRQRAESNMQQLADSYAKLRDQADMIVEIEDQLRRADRLTALGELSAGMAHEIRNPLGSIRGTAEILQDALKDNSRYAEFGQILLNEVDRLNQVVEDFLSFARPADPQQKHFYPTRVLHEVVHLCRQQALKSHVELLWDEQELPAAVGDEAQFKQVFLNLILNALQAMAEQGGQLQISSWEDSERWIVLSFSDTGPGIAAEDLDRVFNPFFTTKQDGTGLGLAITYRIVNNHCGRIRAVNRPEGGAQFILSLTPADQSCGSGDGDG